MAGGTAAAAQQPSAPNDAACRGACTAAVPAAQPASDDLRLMRPIDPTNPNYYWKPLPGIEGKAGGSAASTIDSILGAQVCAVQCLTSSWQLLSRYIAVAAGAHQDGSSACVDRCLAVVKALMARPQAEHLLCVTAVQLLLDAGSAADAAAPVSHVRQRKSILLRVPLGSELFLSECTLLSAVAGSRLGPCFSARA